jgi:hypothetical protein
VVEAVFDAQELEDLLEARARLARLAGDVVGNGDVVGSGERRQQDRLEPEVECARSRWFVLW